MSKKILIFYFLWIFLININFIIAYHGTVGGESSISPGGAILIVMGAIIFFILIIWFFRKASIEIGKKK